MPTTWLQGKSIDILKSYRVDVKVSSEKRHLFMTLKMNASWKAFYIEAFGVTFL
jgi:hypothetical protein